MKLLLSLCIVSFCASIAQAANPVVILDTSMGTIKIELFEDKAPVTVKNFLAYTDDKHYDGTIFHRVMGKENSARDFMIQGGGWAPDASAPIGMKEKPTTKPPIVNESANGVKNQRGTIAMARMGTNPDGKGDGANTATCQFFINVIDNPRLDKEFAADHVGYCVFGKVIEGMEVVNKIKAVKTMRKNEEHANVPTETITLKSVKRQDEKKPEEKK
jgi:cyclophilin family peptidyl-prolyl cis-trans isomerase